MEGIVGGGRSPSGGIVIRANRRPSLQHPAAVTFERMASEHCAVHTFVVPVALRTVPLA